MHILGRSFDYNMASEIKDPGKGNRNHVNVAIDLILKVGTLFLLVFLCYRILRPFLSILLWGLVIAIILFPLFQYLRAWFGNRKKITSLLIMVICLALLVLPSIWLVNQLVDGVRFLAGSFQEGNIHIPPPSETVQDWPLIGGWVYEKWLELSQNMGQSLKGFLPQIADWGQRLFGALANTGLGILQFAVSIIIAGIFLIFFEKGSDSGHRIFKKVVGERGDEFLHISLITIRNVAAGVLGVAVIQTSLMGVGLILANIPLAAVWIVVILIMTIAQIPVMIFNVFMVIYLFAFRDPLPAALWSVYFIVMGLTDNYLKPLIMGKGADVPMLVIFLGAIGGFMAFGFIGLFLGAIILSLAYKLYLTWIAAET
jgi:predicted PurR-regulated permease PerM